ncbi:hypothetical protein [Kitasatospora paracochleata]|uniref:Uncharacterized protein n=1 Tax=Kitasatospora paracochleata TaxID=58354 RepID=A0ABT1JB24_9ACTN|nr:hypothetical protein [Kitasatospora paracochleata]MCP2314278.1 hypothetical protein [Kitasatospora paracochleata]
MLIPREECRRWSEPLGGYGTRVAALLMDDGIPVTHVEVDTGALADDEDGGTVWVGFPPVSTARRAGIEGGTYLSLCWNHLSGWSARGETDRDTLDRWLGAGLEPPPERVAAFAAAALLDFHHTGSTERPYYRGMEHNRQALLDRLTDAYREKAAVPSFRRTFAIQRSKSTRRHVLAQLGDRRPGSVVLGRDEFEALCRVLEWSHQGDWQEYEMAELTEALLADLRSRYRLTGGGDGSGDGAGPVPAQQAFRTTAARQLGRPRRG